MFWYLFRIISKGFWKQKTKGFPKTNALQSWHICFQFLWESEETCKKRQFHLWNIFCLTLSSREERQMSKQGHNPKDLSRFWQRFVKQGKYCRNEMCALGESVKVTASEPGKKQHYSSQLIFHYQVNHSRKSVSSFHVYFWLLLSERISWCWDLQYPLSFLSPLRPLWPLWPLQTGTHTNKERPVTVSRSHRSPQTFSQLHTH